MGLTHKQYKFLSIEVGGVKRCSLSLIILDIIFPRVSTQIL